MYLNFFIRYTSLSVISRFSSMQRTWHFYIFTHICLTSISLILIPNFYTSCSKHRHRSPGSALTCVGSPWSALTYRVCITQAIAECLWFLGELCLMSRLSLYCHHTSIVKTKKLPLLLHQHFQQFSVITCICMSFLAADLWSRRLCYCNHKCHLKTTSTVQKML